jgi:hypothetical protein
LKPIPSPVVEAHIDDLGLYWLTISIPDLPKTINAGGRTHWAVKAKEAQKWISWIAALTLTVKPPRPLPKAILALTRHSSREPDFDGLVSSFKHVIDGLVHAGIIQDDKPMVIGQPAFYWHKSKPKAGHVLIQVHGRVE